MAEGVFQTDRAIFDNPIWKNPPKFRLFFYIYGNAVFAKEGVDIGNIHICRGQLLKSYRNLADDLEYLENRSLKKYSISHLKKLAEQLAEEKRIEVEVTELGTLFTILNYEQYQGFERFQKNNSSSNRTGVPVENPRKMDEFTSAEVRTEKERLEPLAQLDCMDVEKVNQERCENGVRTEQEQNENNNKKDKNVKNVKKINISSKVFSDDSPELNLSRELFNLILNNNPNAKQPNFQVWAKEFDLLIKVDKRNLNDIRAVMTWSQKDDFWKGNILSPKSLRKQFDKLTVQMQTRGGQTNGYVRSNGVSGTDAPRKPKIQPVNKFTQNL